MQSSGKRRLALTSAFEELALHTNERSPEVRDRPRAPPAPLPFPPIDFPASRRETVRFPLCLSTDWTPTRIPRPASVRPDRA